MPAEVRVVRDLDEASPYLDDWRSMAASSRAGLFVSPDWFFSWLAVAHDRCTPLLLLCIDGDRLVGVAPLVQEKSWPRAIRFAGDVSADRTAVLSAPDHPEAQQLLVSRALSLTRSVLVVTHLDDQQALPLRRDTGVVRDQAHQLPWASLDGGWSAFLARRSRNFRADLKRKERTLTEAHEVAYRRTLSEDELSSDLDVFYRLHDDRWSDRGGSTSSSTRARAFLAELARTALASGVLRLWQLTADDRPIAALYGWSFGDTYAYYLAGFDRAYSRHSPGTLLLAHTLKEAAGEGAARYDFLLGDEDYKSRFADGVATVTTLVVSDRRTSPAYLLARTEASARAVLRRLPSGPRATLQRGAVRLGSRLPLTRTR